MNRLLRFEFRKLRGKKSFYICCLIMFGFIFLSALIAKVFAENAEDPAAVVMPTAFSMLRSALSGGNAVLIVGIFTALFVCEDYADGTIKNIYSRGYSRTRVYFAKWIAVCAAALASCAVCLIGAFAVGCAFFETGSDSAGGLIGTLAAQALAVLAYASLFVALSATFRKTGGAVAGCIVAPMIVSMIFGATDSFIGAESFAFADYWLEGLTSALSQSAVSGRTVAVAAVASAAYAALFCLLGNLLNKKREI